MSDAKISFRCPGCEEPVTFPGTDAGTVQECPECGGWVDVPELARSPQLNDPHYEENARLLAESARQTEENARLLALSVRSHEEWQRQLDQSARYQDQAEEAFGRLAALVSRWEGLADRFEQILRRMDERGT